MAVGTLSEEQHCAADFGAVLRRQGAHKMQRKPPHENTQTRRQAAQIDSVSFSSLTPYRRDHDAAIFI